MALITVRNDEDVIDFQLGLILSDVFENELYLSLKSDFRREILGYTQGLAPFYTSAKYKNLFGVDKVLPERRVARYLLQDFLEEPVCDYFISVRSGIWNVTGTYGILVRGLDLALAVSLMDRAVEEGVLEYRVKDYKTREVVLKDLST